MADLQEILLRVLRELGPDAEDHEIAKKMTEYIEALPDSDRAEVNEQMLRLTTSTQLAHLRELAEAETGQEIPGQIIEKPEGGA
jgi:hypothetical protein